MILTSCGNKAQQEAALRDEGIALMSQGDYDGAIDIFNEALGMSMGKVTSLEIDIDYYKAAAQYNGGYFNEAAATYTALIKYDEDNYEPYFLRGSIYADQGEISQAVEDYDNAIACDVKNYLLFIQIYENLNSMGYTDQALRYLNEALDVEDKSANGAYYKGRVYFMLGKYDEAEALLQKAIDKDVIDAKLYMAKLYQARDDWASAQQLLEEYAQSDTVNSQALGSLGDIEMANGNYESALSYYEAGLKLDSIDNLGQLLKGKVAALEQLHRFDEAEEAMAQYLEAYPNDEEAQKELLFIQTR